MLKPVKLGSLTVSRMILGGNPFSGFSHQGVERDAEMVHYHTTAHIKETLWRAQRAGILTHLSRGDHHVIRYLKEYWDEGGTLQWICQTCPEVSTLNKVIDNGIRNGAKAVFFHGGMMDARVRDQVELDELPAAVEKVRRAGLAVGVAGHLPATLRWAEQHLAVDFYMCSYYNPIYRAKGGEHVHGYEETYLPADREAMVETIRGLSKPAIHYKVMAAGRHKPAEALAYVAQHLRPQDAVCVGVCLKDNPGAIEENLRLLETALQRPAAVAAQA